MLEKVLRRPSVVESLHLRSTIGFMAFHGGSLERVTDIIASEAAARSGSSYYGVVQTGDDPLHVPSKHIRPDHSPALRSFFDHVDTVVTIHGYGRDDLRWALLLGGRNRALAAHIASTLRPLLPHYELRDDLSRIPPELAGQHPDNPANLPPRGGVQIELPPTIRWNWSDWAWSDHHPAGRAPHTEALIDGLADAASTWIDVSRRGLADAASSRVGVSSSPE